MALPKILVLTVPTAQPETHAVSLILNVAQEGVQEQWPLTILVRAKASPQHLSTWSGGAAIRRSHRIAGCFGGQARAHVRMERGADGESAIVLLYSTPHGEC